MDARFDPRILRPLCELRRASGSTGPAGREVANPFSVRARPPFPVGGGAQRPSRIIMRNFPSIDFIICDALILPSIYWLTSS